MPDGLFSSTFDETTGVLMISGDIIDEVSTVALRTALADHSDGFSRDMVVDLSTVTFLPSLAVGVLATAREETLGAGRSFEMVAPDGSVAQRVLKVCALPYRSDQPLRG